MARRYVEPQTELGRQLEKERKNRGFSKEVWCDLLGISRPAYNAWLLDAEPGMENIRSIARILGIATSEVFAWVEIGRAKGVYLNSGIGLAA